MHFYSTNETLNSTIAITSIIKNIMPIVYAKKVTTINMVTFSILKG